MLAAAVGLGTGQFATAPVARGRGLDLNERPGANTSPHDSFIPLQTDRARSGSGWHLASPSFSRFLARERTGIVHERFMGS